MSQHTILYTLIHPRPLPSHRSVTTRGQQQVSAVVWGWVIRGWGQQSVPQLPPAGPTTDPVQACAEGDHEGEECGLIGAAWLEAWEEICIFIFIMIYWLDFSEG